MRRVAWPPRLGHRHRLCRAVPDGGNVPHGNAPGGQTRSQCNPLMIDNAMSASHAAHGRSLALGAQACAVRDAEL